LAFSVELKSFFHQENFSGVFGGFIFCFAGRKLFFAPAVKAHAVPGPRGGGHPIRFSRTDIVFSIASNGSGRYPVFSSLFVSGTGSASSGISTIYISRAARALMGV